MLDIVKNRIEIGLDKPVKLLHVTDTHISDTDDRDDALKQRICLNNDIPKIREYFRETIDYCNENCDMMVHSGDLISVVSPRSLEVVREFLDTCRNYLIVAGNHEFSQYCGEAWEGIAYKMTAFQQVQRALREDLLFTAKQVGGVNVVGIDNGYYHVEPWQLWRLQREVKKGLPIVMMMHVPLFEQSLYEESVRRHSDSCAYLMGCDEEHLMPFEEYRAYQQRPTADDLRFIDYVYSQPLIKCVLTGHIHFHYESMLPCGIPQFVTAKNHSGGAREVTLY